MKIAVDATVLWGTHRYSGVEKVVDRLVSRLLQDPRGHDFQVFVPQDWMGFEEDLIEGKVDGGGNPETDSGKKRGPDWERGTAHEAVHRLPFRGSQRLRRILWQQSELPALLRRWKADLVFSPAYVMPLLAPCPAVVFVHDLHGLRRSQTRLENYLHHRLLLPTSLRRAAGILTPTRIVLEKARPYLSSSCVAATAPLGVDPCFRVDPYDSFNASRHPDLDPESSLSVSRSPILNSQSAAPHPPFPNPYILFVSNLEERKGLRLLLEAYALLRELKPGIDLALVGKDRGLRFHLEELAARLGISHQVHFLGFVEQERLPGLYRGASLFVLPSLSEGFGLTPLEAMACGTPVVAVESGAVRENLEEAACFSPSSPVKLSEAFRAVLDDSQLRDQLISRGLVHARKFTWQRTLEAFWRVAEGW